MAAEKLALDPEKCIVFEDSVAGVEAANRAKMYSIGIGDKEVLGAANENFVDFTEIDVENFKKLI